MTYLGVEPGAVMSFDVINDTEGKVRKKRLRDKTCYAKLFTEFAIKWGALCGNR